MLIFRACEPTGRAPFWETGVANPLWCSCLGRGMRTPCAHVWAGECEPDVPGSFLGGECEPKARAHVWAGECEPAVPGSFLGGECEPKARAHVWAGECEPAVPGSFLGGECEPKARLIFGRGMRTQARAHHWWGMRTLNPCSFWVGDANLWPFCRRGVPHSAAGFHAAEGVPSVPQSPGVVGVGLRLVVVLGISEGPE